MYIELGLGTNRASQAVLAIQTCFLRSTGLLLSCSYLSRCHIRSQSITFYRKGGAAVVRAQRLGGGQRLLLCCWLQVWTFSPSLFFRLYYFGRLGTIRSLLLRYLPAPSLAPSLFDHDRCGSLSVQLPAASQPASFD